MKFILLFFIFFTSVVKAETIQLISTTPNEVKRGDIVVFQVKTSHSLDELKKYENKRVGELIYLLEFKKEKENILVEGIIAERGIKEKLKPLDDEFKLYNLNFIPTEKKGIKDFIVFEGPKLITKDFYIYYGIILILILCYPLFLVVKRLQKKKKERTKYLNIQKDFKNIINNAQDRKTFEVIFSKRKEFENFFIYNKNKFEDFIKVLNQYQFKKEINEDELKVIQAKFTEFKKTIEDKNGI